MNKVTNTIKYLLNNHIVELFFILTMLGIITKGSLILLPFFVGLILYELFAKKNPLALLPILLMGLPAFGANEMFVKDDNISTKTVILVAIVTIPLMISLAVAYIKSKKEFKLNWLTISFGGLAATALLALVNANDLAISFVGFLMFLLYFACALVMTSIKQDKYDENFVYKSYFWWAVVIILQVVNLLLKAENLSQFILDRQINLYWGYSNNISNALTIAAPFIAVYAAKSKGLKKIPLYAVVYASIVLAGLTLSRNGALSAAIVAPMIAVLVFKFEQSKKSFFKVAISFLLVGVATWIFMVQVDIIPEYVEKILDRGFDSNGRKILYEIALNNWKNHRIIGSGAFSSAYYTVQDGKHSMMYSFHSVFYDILTDLGIVGIVFLTFFCVNSVIYFIRSNHKNAYKWAFAVSLVPVIVFSVSDIAHYNPLIMVPVIFHFVVLKSHKSIIAK